MKSTDIPAKQAVPFGVNGQREALLPTTPAGDNKASYNNGFPPVTMIMKSAGGVPPKGQDMNQILFELSSLCRWFSAGGAIKFDVDFCTSIGGYPNGSYIMGDDNKTVYRCTKNDNTNNPNSSTDGWVKVADDISSIIGLKGAAYLDVGESSGTVAAGNDQRIISAFREKGDLLDLNINTIGSPDSSGIYYQPQNSKATTSKGYPINEAGVLLVAKSANSGCYQEFTTYLSSRKFSRGLTGIWNGNGPWGEWVEYVRRSDTIGGPGMSWKNLTSSRVSGVTYTNTLPRPIQISVCSGTRISSSMYVDSMLVSTTFATPGSGDLGAQLYLGSLIVPFGSTYRVECSNILSWMELS